jgi:hypothetical protein
MFQLARITEFQFFLGIAALATILFTAFRIVRGMKGEVGIELAKDGLKFPFYTTGEEIAGEVTITIRKNLHMNRFYVALIGYEIVEHHDGYATLEIYRREHNLAGVGILTAGMKHSFEFTLVAPGSNSPREQEGRPEATDNTTANVVGLANAKRRLKWELEIRADLLGIDLSSSRKVWVNLI